MKKINLVLMSMLAIVLSSVLAACSFKKAEATFSQSEIVVSLEDTIKLDEYLSVKNIEKNEVSFKYSNSSLFEANGRSIVAKQAGKSFVYATYQNNNLASMKIVVREKFSAPMKFELATDGTLSWNAVSAYYENETAPTKAQSYRVVGTCTVYSPNDPATVLETEDIDETVSTNSIKLSKAGKYEIGVQSIAYGYFDKSELSSVQTLYFGYMDKLEEKDLTWNSEDGNLTWSAVAGARYRVCVDGVMIDSIQSATSKDLSSTFNSLESGEHEVSVFVYDISGQKMVQESEKLTIVKLDAPVASYEFSQNAGGQIKIEPQNDAKDFEISLRNTTSNQTVVLTYSGGDDVVFADLTGLASGIYEAKIIAKNTNGNFYKSNVTNFGKVYKMPKLNITALGNNTLDGTIFNAKIAATGGLVDATTLIGGIKNDYVLEGLDVGQSEKNLELELLQSGIFNVSATNTPKQKANTISGDAVFAINADKSDEIQVVKLAQFSEEESEKVKHSYQDEKSVFAFKTIENATGYELNYYRGETFEKVESSLYNVEISDGTAKITFTGKIEDLFGAQDFEDKNVFRFQIVAKTSNDSLTISSSVIKTLTLLSAPETTHSGNSVDKTYTWGEVENADGYKLELYVIDKDVFDSNQSNINIETAGLTKSEHELQNASYVFERVGYFYSKIYATTTNVDEFVSSQDCLQEVFYIAEKLQNGAVKFGYDENYKNQTGFTGSTGYFVKVENSENIDRYEVSIDGDSSTIFKTSETDSNVYLLSKVFEDGVAVDISVVGHALDETIYLASDPTTLSIEKLAKVAYDDLQIDDLTTTLSISERSGATGVKIWESDGNFALTEDGTYPQFDISRLSNFSLKFNLYGTKIADKIYQDTNGKIYLDSDDSTIAFKRLQSPSNLKYYDGNITFEHDALPPATKYYVLDLLCKTANGEDIKISIKFDTFVSATYDGTTVPIGLQTSFISYSGNTSTIKLSQIINLIKESEDLADIYNQTTQIKFAVYGYQKLNDASGVTLSSYYATAYGDSTKDYIVVEKMSASVLTFKKQSTDFVLNWTESTTTASVSAETKYQLYLDGEEKGGALTGLTYSIASSEFKDSTYYTFYIKSSNPYYLESNNSNIIRIYKLRGLSRVSLTDQCSLNYEIYTSETDFVDYVSVKKPSVTIQDSSGVVSITESGEYVFKLIGKTVENAGETTYYVDSKDLAWTLAEMSTISPANKTISYANNLLSWNKFGEEQGLESLEYIVVFKDENGATATFKTTQTSVDLSLQSECYETISSLSAGQIKIQVSAHLNPYAVAVGGTIYYAQSAKLLDDKTECNHLLYTENGDIKKLTTPDVTNVEFDSADLENSQFPEIKISFVGNYGNEGKFTFYFNDDDTTSWTSSLTQTNGKYTFSISKENYNNKVFPGDILKVKIKAVSDKDIPSSLGEVEIERVVDLQSVVCEKTEEKYNGKIKFTFNPEKPEYSLGGVVVKVEYQEDGEDVKTEYFVAQTTEIAESLTYDMSSFIETKLVKGGTIKLSAFINNYANDTSKVYYLAAPNMVESDTYYVLKSVENVTRTTGGFYIDETLNGQSTTYVVEYGASRFEVVANQEGKFYFEFPNDWENDSYTLKIYAVEDNFIKSSTNSITFSLNRIDKVSSVTMQRADDDLSDVTLSWNHVTGATGYLVKMFARTDVEKTDALYEFNTTKFHQEAGSTFTPVGGKVSYSMIEIFGKNYKKLTEYGKVTAYDLMSDIDVVFDVVAIGDSTYNNSKAYSFNASLKGNPIAVKDISYDEYGKITFVSLVGTTYLYRFVDASGTELQTWKTVYAESELTKLEASNLETKASFNVEIIAVGSAVSEPATSTDFEFVLDSVPVSTLGSNMAFIINDEIIKIGYHESLPSSLAITLVPNSCTRLYVGLNKDSISKEEVVGIVPNEEFASEVEAQYVYSYNFISIINQLREAGYTVSTADNVDLYFWSYRGTIDTTGTYLISKPYKFSFKFATENQFNTIKKIGNLGEESKLKEDYANSYAVFNNVDVEGTLETVGIYIKITQLSTGETNTDGGDEGEENPDETPTEPEEQSTGEEKLFSTIKFFTKAQMTGNEYFDGQNVFVVNISALFEDEDLANLTGTFKIEFARIQVSKSTTEDDYKFILSDWLSASPDKEFVFERLAVVKTLNLINGNLYWTPSGEKTQKYYVYFMQSLEGSDYTYFDTENLFFNASEFATTESCYYIAVQSISEDPYMLSSIKVFVTEVKGGISTPVLVYKNQMKSSIQMKDGKLIIDWDKDGDFYKVLTQEGDYGEIAKELTETVFTNPFTFTISQLLNNEIKLRLRFTSINGGTEGVRKVFDINAKYLLADLFEFGTANGYDVEKQLKALYTNSGNSATGKIISEFSTFVQNGSHGIANSSVLFDDLFESVQLGNYKLDYCLLGNTRTLNSSWYKFENKNKENILYVNGEPSIKAIKSEGTTDKAINAYKVLIKKSEIYNYVDGAYVKEIAENYKFKIYDDAGNTHVFSITKGISSYSLSLQGSKTGKTVSVYETDLNGEQTQNGAYLMFYINHNSGNSILGVYDEEINRTNYKMQIFAVGNDYSLSSKSEFFNLVLLSFGQTFTVSNGEFVWGGINNRKTSIIYKKNTSSTEGVTEIEGSMVSSRYSLEGLGYGLYDYIRFVNIGEVKANTIFVDSEILQVNNVYKLAPPRLNNNMGYIGIDDSANISMLGVATEGNTSTQICYSDGNIYNYILYNSDPASKIMFSDENCARDLLYYEVGTTGMELTNADYDYKNTEENAKEFYVSSIGTTASVNIEKDASEYYLRKIYCKDAVSGESSSKNIAIRSQFAKLDAAMIDAVQAVRVENGLLQWASVNGRTGADVFELPQDTNAKVVYKVTIAQYKESNTQEGMTETNVGIEYFYYTTKSEFDFSLIKEEQLVDTGEVTYLKATVQALALNVTKDRPTEKYVELIEGGYASGNVQYANSALYVLMGNGAVLKKIDRIAPIDEDSLTVSNGSLYWTYTVDAEIEEQSAFFEKYSFIVTDSNEKKINGDFIVETITKDYDNNKNIFKIKFVEYAGEMKDGLQTIKVYTTQGVGNQDVVIKSFARAKEITKLKTISQDDYTITSEGVFETLDLSNYYEDANTNKVTLSIQIVGGEDTKETTVDFVGGQCKIYILKSEDDAALLTSYPDDYVKNYIVITDNQIAKLTFKTSCDAENTLYSDLSNEFILQRSSWGENGKIEWDAEQQIFSWNYNGYYTLKEEVKTKRIKKENVLTGETVLYNDTTLQEASDITLAKDTIITVDEIAESYTKIYYQQEIYYISSKSYTLKDVEMEENTLTTDVLFKVLETKDGKSLIELQNKDTYYVDATNIVEPVYIVEVSYGEEPNLIVRTYTTTENTFTPTIISDKISFKVRIKLGDANIQSSELVYTSTSGENYVSFDLFASGDGTSSAPYRIFSKEQFLNIKKRMKKSAMLTDFSESTRQIEEAEQFYFSLETNVVLSDANDTESYLNGILFKGEFDGVLEGNGYKVSYISNGVEALSKNITISDGNVLGPTSETSFTYGYGTSLFETLTSKSSISNLDIDVAYADEIIANDSLMAGLAIVNNGKIKNVNLVGFDSKFVGFIADDERVIMVYSGIVSINSGYLANISNCGVKTSMSISDGSKSQLIFVSGIVFTNYGTIEDCSVGINDTEKQSIKVTSQSINNTIQVAGVVVTNTSTATLRRCTNYFHITIENTRTTNYNVVYIAGVADLGRGTMQELTNSADTNAKGEKFTLINVNESSSSLFKGEIYAK